MVLDIFRDQCKKQTTNKHGCIGNMKMKPLVSCELVWDGTTPPRQQSVSSGTRVSPLQLARTGELSRLARWVRAARGPGLAMNLSGASLASLLLAANLASLACLACRWWFVLVARG